MTTIAKIPARNQVLEAVCKLFHTVSLKLEPETLQLHMGLTSKNFYKTIFFPEFLACRLTTLINL